MKSDWVWCPEVFSKEQCEEIVDSIYKLPEPEQYGGVLSKNPLDLEYRRNKIKWVDANKYTQFKPLVNELWEFINVVNEQVFEVDVNLLGPLQFTEYVASEFSEYKSHKDITWLSRSTHRKISLVLQLTDSNDYDGGDLILEDAYEKPDLSVIRKQGSLIAFSSYVMHKVTPVTRGKRNSIVAWFEGPHFR